MYFFKYYFVVTTLSLLPVCAEASFWSDISGVLTDPVKLDSTSKNIIHSVERMGIHATRIQDELDADIRDYLVQMDGTISDTREWAIDAIKETEASVLRVEAKFIADTADLITCSVEHTTYAMRQLLADSLNDIGLRKPRFELFGWKIGEVKIDPSDIPSPIAGFRQAMEIHELRISNVVETDHPSKITDGYSEIQRLAHLTKCHYSAETVVYRELQLIDLEYSRRGRAWSGSIALQ